MKGAKPMTKKSLLRLILLNAIPAALSFFFPLGAGAIILAVLAQVLMVVVNFLISDRFWISLLVMAISAALCVCGSMFSTVMYYTYINRGTETLLVGDLITKIVAVVGIVCVALYGIMELIRSAVKKHRERQVVKKN